MKKFSDLKKGERVIYKISTNQGIWGTVIQTNVVSDDNLLLPLFSSIEIKLDNGLVKNVYEHDIYIPGNGVTYINTNMLECDCGLKYIRDGGKHSSWCKISYSDSQD